MLECSLVHREFFFFGHASSLRNVAIAFKDKSTEKAKINFDWPLDLLRSETVKVYVNNEINILVFF